VNNTRIWTSSSASRVACLEALEDPAHSAEIVVVPAQVDNGRLCIAKPRHPDCMDVRRGAAARFKESDDAGKASAADPRKKAKTKAKGRRPVVNRQE